ncbi:type II toxin-antitoxin system PemK/MazF family toxin [Candidatus Saccharibacteria bacterium]|nr:type II toxin-antitoxin system PemK/MazF family toxin [Candidatus Saccharibacteria bacterium]
MVDATFHPPQTNKKHKITNTPTPSKNANTNNKLPSSKNSDSKNNLDWHPNFSWHYIPPKYIADLGLSEDELRHKREGFARWDMVKQHLDIHGNTQRVRSGEIYWAGIGENIGIEINGKGNEFARPVLVVRKINHHAFFGVPLTTQPHEQPGFIRFEFQGKMEYAALMQLRSFSTKRLYRRMGKVDDKTLEELRHQLRIILC